VSDRYGRQFLLAGLLRTFAPQARALGRLASTPDHFVDPLPRQIEWLLRRTATSDGQLLKNFHNELSHPILRILIGYKEIESESSL
jgi:hypothetical protein